MISLDFSVGLKLLSLAVCSFHYFYLADYSLTVVRHGTSHFKHLMSLLCCNATINLLLGNISTL